MRARTAIALCAWLSLASGGWVVAGQEAAGCEPAGDIRFICDLIGPEDLAIVPGDEWVVASGNQEGGRIHLVNVADKTTSVLFPTPDRAERLDAATYPSCPGPLEAEELDNDEFRAHGLFLKPGAGDVHDLYVVHHGRRESIEVFELDAGAAPMTLAWVGCAVAPEGLRLNSVVALPEGGFAATSTSTGDVWEWSTDSGWSVIPGTDDTTPNGLEISPDGAWLYVAGWRGEKLTRLSRGRTPRQRDVVPIGFRPDNLRFVDGGAQILAAGHGNFGTPEETSNVAVIDPQTLEVRRIFQHPRIDGFAASTAAIRIGGEIWLGTNRGRMIAWFPAPE
ncbi:MAG: hypothetical protein OXH69_07525 [Acidobacteria bacterium]|nr:hypothetical protein [Acidobacteriota bacterium]